MDNEHEIIFIFEGQAIKARILKTKEEENLIVYVVRPADPDIVRRFGPQVCIKRNEFEFERVPQKDEVLRSYHDAIIYGILAKKL